MFLEDECFVQHRRKHKDACCILNRWTLTVVIILLIPVASS